MTEGGASTITVWRKKKWIIAFTLFALMAFGGANHAEAFSLKKLGKAIIKVIVRSVNTVSSLVSTVVSAVTDCERDGVHGIPTMCFKANDRAKIHEALSFLEKQPTLLARGSEQNMYRLVMDRTRQMINMESRQVKFTYPQFAFSCKGATKYGCHLAGTTALTSLAFTFSKPKLAAAILHESDHASLHLHNCGESADKDLSGPYALEAFSLMEMYHNEASGLTLGERSEAFSRASSIARYQLCSDEQNAQAVLDYKPVKVRQLHASPPMKKVFQRLCDRGVVKGPQCMQR